MSNVESRYGVPTTSSHGQAVLHLTADRYLEVVKALFDDGFSMCIDLTAVDFLTHRHRSLPEEITQERFEVVVNFLSLSARERIRIRVQVSEDALRLPSLFPFFPGTEAMEREVFDLFGITFEGHPDLTRILMPEDWEGHPLRKDYDMGSIPVQFKSAASQR